MKKVVSLFIIFAMCASLFVAFTSCSSKHPVDEFFEKMENADSYQMDITMSDIPLFGTLSFATKVDGNIQYTPSVMFSEEEYTETVGDVTYKYTKDSSGKWTKTTVEVSDEESDILAGQLESLFVSDNFEKVDGEENTFKQKSGVNFDNFEDVKITIAEDSCTIEMKANSEGMLMGVKIVVSKIGEIELTLPEVG